MLCSKKGENGFIDETFQILIQPFLWLIPYSLVRDFGTTLIMKWTLSKLFNKNRLMPNWMLDSWILTLIIFSSIKTLHRNYQTKTKNTASKFSSNYFRQLLYDITSHQRIVLCLDFVSGQIVSKGIDIFARFHVDEIYSVNSLLKLNRE